MRVPATTARPPKRQRLIDSARELIHEQGVQRTTLAQIAERADVPPGNVYYYYKTRDELVHAVIESRVAPVSSTVSCSRAATSVVVSMPSPASTVATASGWVM